MRVACLVCVARFVDLGPASRAGGRSFSADEPAAVRAGLVEPAGRITHLPAPASRGTSFVAR